MKLPPCAILLFGATGDLAKQKLIPALFAMHTRGDLPQATRIIAIGRKDLDDAAIRKEYRGAIKKAPGWEGFAKRIAYHQLEFHDPTAYDKLLTRVRALPASIRDNRLFYLATPQDAFPLIITQLARTKLGERSPKTGWHRVVFEKPFGSDLATATALNNAVGKLFDETQVYRIDHYLGKSFVQEILAIRFANPMFDNLWNRNYVDNVQIVVCETGGVGTRGGYYDHSGAIRDMVQNHLLQLLSLVAMEAPTRSSAEEIRHEKAKALRSIEPKRGREQVVTGQYRAGKTVIGKIPDYVAEKGIAKSSQTETYTAIRLFVHNHRWTGVPFYLRTGKALAHRYAEIAITFKQGPCVLFSENGCPESNVLVIRIQPDEGLKIRFNLADGATDAVRVHEMDFSHKAQTFNTPEAYELLLGEAFKGDQTLFTGWEFLQESWRITDALRAMMTKPESYKAGTHGPDAALQLLRQDGRDWVGNQQIAHIGAHQRIKRKR